MGQHFKMIFFFNLVPVFQMTTGTDKYGTGSNKFGKILPKKEYQKIFLMKKLSNFTQLNSYTHFVCILIWYKNATEKVYCIYM